MLEDFNTTSMHNEYENNKEFERFIHALSDLAISNTSISNSIITLANGINAGISRISENLTSAALSDRYYSLLDRLLSLSKQYPNLELDISSDYITNNLITLSEENVIALSFLFTYSDQAFDMFKVECESGILSPSEWIDSFFLRSYFTSQNYGVEIRFGDKYLKKDPNKRILLPCKVLEKASDYQFEDTEKQLYKNGYTPDSKTIIMEALTLSYKSKIDFASLAKGYSKLQSWVSEQNTRFLIKYLGEIYSTAVTKVVSSK